MNLPVRALKGSDHIRLADNIYYKEAEAIILLTPDKKNVIKIDGVVRHIWKLLKNGATFDTMVSHIEKNFDADKETIAADLSKWLKEANKEKLIEITN